MGSTTDNDANNHTSQPATPDERPVIYVEGNDSFLHSPEVQAKLVKNNEEDEVAKKEDGAIGSSSPASCSINSSGKDEEKKKTKSKKKDRNKRTKSIGNLAQHSLVLSQLFHFERKTEPNVASINKFSLMGKTELEKNLPKKEIKIFIATWNMNGEAPPINIGSLLWPSEISLTPDIIIFSTQESYPDEDVWELLLQTTLGISYVLYHTAHMGTLRMVIFLRKELTWNVSAVDEDSHSVRIGKAFKTKGGIAVAFYLFGTSFLFINSHLTAHEHKYEERLEDVRKIIKNIDLPDKLPDIREKRSDGSINATDCFDYVFWMGDLNFRLKSSRNYVIRWVKNSSFPLRNTLPRSLYDQLATAMSEGQIFRGFREPPLTFPPTFKYDCGTNEFDSSHKQRTPSYTDRILFKCNSSVGGTGGSSLKGTNPVQAIAYNSVPTVATSDHKPVWGLFKCRVKPGSDDLPLNAGYFKRDVYLEALKKRNHDQREYQPEPCCIQ